MLTKLLEHLKTLHGEVDQALLCAELGISPDTLQNLLDLLARKGLITYPHLNSSTCQKAKPCLSNGKPCPGPEECNLVLLAPKQVSFLIQKTTPK